MSFISHRISNILALGRHSVEYLEFILYVVSGLKLNFFQLYIVRNICRNIYFSPSKINSLSFITLKHFLSFLSAAVWRLGARTKKILVLPWPARRWIHRARHVRCVRTRSGVTRQCWKTQLDHYPHLHLALVSVRTNIGPKCDGGGKMWKRAEWRGERSRVWIQPPAGRLNRLGQSLACAGLVRTFELYSPPRTAHSQPRFLSPPLYLFILFSFSFFHFNHLLSSPWLTSTYALSKRGSAECKGWAGGDELQMLTHIQWAGSQRRLALPCRSTGRAASVGLVARSGLAQLSKAVAIVCWTFMCKDVYV